MGSYDLKSLGASVLADHTAQVGCFQITARSDNLLNIKRTRSLNAPSPIQQFGPCGRIMKNSAMVMERTDWASKRAND
uniref:Uncharacterized protein n=1 Tax=Timema poppense TaxID=170557 RepID=A0A7R9CVX9_TIMPO|nr:unnamed protein product [Timema poppensis]